MKKELTYTAGKLGRKLGVSREKIRDSLEKLGLMKDCYKDQNGWLQIPYSVAVQLSSEAALAVETPKEKSSKRKRKSAAKEEEEDLDLVELGLMPPKTKEDYFPSARKRTETANQIAVQKFATQREYCRTLACLLSQMGVTPQMYMEAYKKQKEEANEEETEEETEPLQTVP